MIANADGTDQRALTHAGKGEVHIDAQFSPNGKWIAYEARRRGVGVEVRLVRPDGTQDHRLPVGVQGPLPRRRHADLDLQQAALLREGEGPDRRTTTRPRPCCGRSNIDGSGLLRMSDKRDAGKYEDSRAQVTPDGSFVTWTRLRLSDGKSTIMRVDVDGDDPAPILPWGLGVEVYDLSTRDQRPDRGPGAVRGLRPRRPGRDVRRPRHGAVGLQRRQAVPQEDRVADRQRGQSGAATPTRTGRPTAATTCSPTARTSTPRTSRSGRRGTGPTSVARSRRRQRFDYRPDWGIRWLGGREAVELLSRPWPSARAAGSCRRPTWGPPR